MGCQCNRYRNRERHALFLNGILCWNKPGVPSWSHLHSLSSLSFQIHTALLFSHTFFIFDDFHFHFVFYLYSLHPCTLQSDLFAAVWEMTARVCEALARDP